MKARPTIVGKCNDCGEHSRLYRLWWRWLCETCFTLRKESL